MLHILLMILKIIGILIAVIFGLLLLSFLVIVCAPLHYQIDGACGGNKDSLKIEVRGRWLYRLISGFVCYESESTNWQIRIGWKKMNQAGKQEPEDTPENQTSHSEDVSRKSEPIMQEQKMIQEKNPQIQESVTQKESDWKGENPEESRSQQQRRKKRKRISITERWKALFRKIKFTITKICDTIKGIGEKKEKILEFIEDETHQAAFLCLKKEMIRLLHFLKPQSVKGRVHYGFEDPYDTGRVLAGLSILYPFYGESLSIEPDFEKKGLEGELHIRGKLRGIHVGIVLFNLFRSKEIRTTYQHVRKFRL